MHFPAEGRSGRGRREETNIQNKTTADWMGMWRVGNWLVTVVGNQLGDPRVRAGILLQYGAAGNSRASYANQEMEEEGN